MKRLVTLSFLIFISGFLFGQTALLSDVEKVEFTLSSYEIIGKQNNQILLIKYGQNQFVFRVYDDNLKFVREHAFELDGKRIQLEGVLKQSNSIELFFSSKLGRVKKVEKFVVQDAEINKADFEHVVGVKNFEGQQIEIIQSKKGESNYLLRIDDQGRSSVLIDVLDINKNEKYQIKFNEKYWRYLKTEVAAYGDLLILIENKTANPSNNDYFKILHWNKKEIQTIAIGKSDTIIHEATIKIDELNNQLLCLGLYSKNNRKNVEGLFYFSYQLNNSLLNTESFIPFSDQLAKEITGKERKENRDFYLSNLKIRDIILKHNGGAIISLEKEVALRSGVSYPITENNTLYDAIWQPETQTQFKYGLVLVFNLDVKGKLLWDQIIFKDQISLDDDGVYSSFILMNEGNQLRYLYNEKLGRQVRLHSFSLNVKGEGHREDVFNSEDRTLLLAPRYAKQTASNEVVIPSFTRQSFRLFKIIF